MNMDSVADRLDDGPALRVLTVVVQFSRECVRLESGALSGMRDGKHPLASRMHLA
jgi:hypothetical protein